MGPVVGFAAVTVSLPRSLVVGALSLSLAACDRIGGDSPASPTAPTTPTTVTRREPVIVPRTMAWRRATRFTITWAVSVRNRENATCERVNVVMRFYDDRAATPPHILESKQFVDLLPLETRIVESSLFARAADLDKVKGARASLEKCLSWSGRRP